MRGRHTADDVSDRDARHDFWGAVLEAPDASALARFYVDLLGWALAHDDGTFAAIAPSSGVAYLGFQTAPTFVPPVWPPAEGTPHMTMHLDFEVSDLDAAVDHAIELGARLASAQPQESVRVLLDPAGHPFCLYVDA
jgi:catechol 2,3-dioxygenase-like lactoylglutathione lyase family enzyme